MLSEGCISRILESGHTFHTFSSKNRNVSHVASESDAGGSISTCPHEPAAKQPPSGRNQSQCERQGGVVLFHLAKKKICLVKFSNIERWNLPTERRNCGESRAKASITAAESQTGFKCNLLPVSLVSKARDQNDPTGPIAPKTFHGVIEPFWISVQPTRSSATDAIVRTWCITAIDERQDMKTVTGEEELEVALFSYNEALVKVSYQDHLEVLEKALHIVTSTSFRPEISTSSNQRGRSTALELRSLIIQIFCCVHQITFSEGRPYRRGTVGRVKENWLR
ncbi:MAG: hypothetical protein MMC33_006124 [Icmadophila ericetorum]|nr:hypothetical protein [Icmadophila ericetorum]